MHTDWSPVSLACLISTGILLTWISSCYCLCSLFYPHSPPLLMPETTHIFWNSLSVVNSIFHSPHLVSEFVSTSCSAPADPEAIQPSPCTGGALFTVTLLPAAWGQGRCPCSTDFRPFYLTALVLASWAPGLQHALSPTTLGPFYPVLMDFLPV